MTYKYTSIWSNGFSSSQESEIPGPGVDLTRVARDQPGAEVILITRIVSVNCVIPTCVVRALNPNLKKKLKTNFKTDHQIWLIGNYITYTYTKMKSSQLPYLSQMWISTLAFCVRICDDDVEARKKFSGFHQCQRMRGSPFCQCHPVIAESP